MKKIIVCVGILGALSGNMTFAGVDVNQPKWTASGFDHPESAYYAPEVDQIFVSNVGGDAFQKDGQGWISQLDKSGKVLKAKWFEGLNAPKGLRSYQGTLWVSDLDEVVAIDLKTAQMIKKIKFPGAKFLNDIAIDSAGNLYVSDTVTGAIYRKQGKSQGVFAKSPATEFPNGLLIEGNSLVVAAWGHALNDSKSTTKGHLFRFNLKTRKKTLITPSPVGALDGLESYENGGYLISDWVSGEVFEVSAKGERKLILSIAKNGSADIGYIPSEKLLLVPRMIDNTVVAFSY